jgi:hypothetical protein
MSEIAIVSKQVKDLASDLVVTTRTQLAVMRTLREENESVHKLNALLRDEVHRLRYELAQHRSTEHKSLVNPNKSLVHQPRPTEPPTTYAPRMYVVFTKPQTTCTPRGPVEVSVAPVAEMVILYAY